MSSFSQADHDFAFNLLNQGEDPKTVQGKLMERGMAKQAAGDLVNELHLQALCGDAMALLKKGCSSAETADKLAEKGYDAKTAQAMVDGLAKRGVGPARKAGFAQMFLFFVGGAVMLAGIGLFIGNVSGFFPTFPGLGYLTIVVGVGMMGAASKV